jgi:hypothetical protein
MASNEQSNGSHCYSNLVIVEMIMNKHGISLNTHNKLQRRGKGIVEYFRIIV